MTKGSATNAPCENGTSTAYTISIGDRQISEPSTVYYLVVVSNMFFFIPKIGEMIQFDEHIFSDGLAKKHKLGMLVLGVLILVYFNPLYIYPKQSLEEVQSPPKKPI